MNYLQNLKGMTIYFSGLIRFKFLKKEEISEDGNTKLKITFQMEFTRLIFLSFFLQEGISVFKVTCQPLKERSVQ